MPKRQPGLDVATVVKASLAIADAEGVERLTMRRLATELGVTPMAIYHHVESKEQLLDIVADESLRDLPPVDVDRPWRDELAGLFLAFHQLFLSHPALASVMAQRPLEGPNAVAVAESVLTMFARAGFSDDHAVSALISLFNYTIGASLYRLSRRQHDAGRSRLAVHGSTAARLREKLADAAVRDEQFSHGLRRLLDSYAK